MKSRASALVVCLAISEVWLYFSTYQRRCKKNIADIGEAYGLFSCTMRGKAWSQGTADVQLCHWSAAGRARAPDMAGGLLIVPDNHIKTYNGRLTWQVVLTCIVASTGGLLFGWGALQIILAACLCLSMLLKPIPVLLRSFDNGITGGVTSMHPFLQKFFPDVYAHVTSTISDGSNAYCASTPLAASLRMHMPPSNNNTKHGVACRQVQQPGPAALHLLALHRWHGGGHHWRLHHQASILCVSLIGSWAISARHMGHACTARPDKQRMHAGRSGGGGR